MAVVDRIFATVIMVAILIFAILHVGVSIGIIVPFRKYGDIFTPQVGLASYNLVVGFVGLITGVLGLVAVWFDVQKLGKVVCGISVVLGIFALASLITALVINAKSPSYVRSHFTSDMLVYQTNPGAQNKIDLLQIKYQCCGTNLWIEWANAGLNTNSSSVATTVSTVTTTTTVSTITNTTSSASGKKRNIAHIFNDLHPQQLIQLADYSRKKRQAAINGNVYGGIDGLPITFGVVLPRSCCTAGALLTSNASTAYCVSNANDAINYFNTNGCAQSLEKAASDQAMGIGVINSFMIVLAFVAIPILLGEPSVHI